MAISDETTTTNPTEQSVDGRALLATARGLGGYGTRSTGVYDNPGADIAGGLVARRSQSSAEGFWFIDQPQYWDWLDESFRTVPPLAMATRFVHYQILRNTPTFSVSDDYGDEGQQLMERVRDALLPHISRLIFYLFEGAARHGFSIVECVYNPDFTPREFIHHHPGLFAFTGERQAIRYAGMKQGQPLEPWKFLRMTSPVLYNNPFGNPYPLQLVGDVTAYRECTRTLLELLDRYGTPLVKVQLKEMLPEGIGTASYERQMAALDVAVKGLSRDRNGIMLPSWVESMEFIDRQGYQAALPHFQARKEAAENIVIFIAGSSLGILPAQYGTQALGQVQAETNDNFANAWAWDVEDVIQKFVNEYVRLIHPGPNYPKIEFSMGVRSRIDRELIEAFYNFAFTNGIEIDLDQFYKDFDRNKPVEGEGFTAPLPSAPAPAGLPLPMEETDGALLPEGEDDGAELPEPPPNIGPLSRAGQASAALGVGRAALRNWARKGMPGAYRIGKTAHYDVAAIKRWLSDGAEFPAPAVEAQPLDPFA